MGVVSPLGHDLGVFYNNLLQGVSGVTQIEAFDCAQFPTRIAGEIKSFSTDGWVAPKLSKRMDKFMLYMLTAGKKALADGGITEDVMDELNKRKCGVLIGSAMGGMKVFNDAIEALRISYKKMNPFCVPFATTNMGSAMLGMDLGWMGPNYSISTACATSNFCILNAANHIIRAIIPIGLGGFVACRALSQRNDDPTKASRPWDMNRDGFVMGEGAGVLLLEELEHAKKRGANIYAEFLGGSFTCDAYHMTEPRPDGAGVILCIEKALSQSGISKEDVNYVNAHATSTPAGDLKEYQALMHCFVEGERNKIHDWSLTGSSWCSGSHNRNTGNTIRTGWVHPNINLENPDQGVDTSVLVGPKKERLDIKAALSNSFGFGGHNSSIIFAPFNMYACFVSVSKFVCGSTLPGSKCEVHCYSMDGTLSCTIWDGEIFVLQASSNNMNSVHGEGSRWVCLGRFITWDLHSAQVDITAIHFMRSPDLITDNIKCISHDDAELTDITQIE
ncbi:3-OXOACYL-[ACYL-CARRIER-PROTEIN] SYNTHASE II CHLOROPLASTIC [Salix koriyanagi]|uniref:beta-ketoacyl-[acyl-carrier-protein] synthase I n=2 Tax=Salix TaxID=40685 RepID=A0A9Q1A620_9ROSI|nr:3-OXOACYL-[ACYL-CARRIER-PROTEIN] SYNTHASE II CHLOROPLASTIC [Salix koriyanagi]